MKLFFDGAYSPAAGMATAVAVSGRNEIRRDLGPGGSMEAEWLALIEAMRTAHAMGLSDTILLGDAAAVIAQANGTAKCPPSCAGYLATFRTLPRPPGRVRIRWIKRTQNLAGIALAQATT